MSTRWLYSEDGKPTFYQQGQFLYSAANGDCCYEMKEAWFLDMDGGEPCFYQADKWLYTPDGKPVFYYD